MWAGWGGPLPHLRSSALPERASHPGGAGPSNQTSRTTSIPWVQWTISRLTDPLWLLALAFVLWAVDDSSLTQRYFSKSRNSEEWLNDWHHWAFESRTTVGWFCFYQNSLWRMQEMARILFRAGMWRSKVQRERMKLGPNNQKVWGLLALSSCRLFYNERTHPLVKNWKATQRKKNYHPFVMQVKLNHYQNVSVFLLLIFFSTYFHIAVLYVYFYILFLI